MRRQAEPTSVRGLHIAKTDDGKFHRTCSLGLNGFLRSWASHLLLGMLVSLALLSGRGEAQETDFPMIDPAQFGFDLPSGEYREGADRRVATVDEDGNPAIGKVHVQVGQRYVVMLPDGQLVVRTAEEAPLTERPFVPATNEALIDQICQGQLADFNTRETAHYLCIYNTTEDFAVATNSIMETMLPGLRDYAHGQQIEAHPPEVPLVVIMFATEEEYQQYQRMPPGAVAYYDFVSNRVVLYERGPNDSRMPQIAFRRAIATIAHEGAHQILHNIGVQQRLSMWPMWLTEGMAEFYAPTETRSRYRWRGAGQVNDMRMFELEQYLQSRPEDSDGDLVRDTIVAPRLSSTGYATAWALTHYLARNRREEFHRYIRDLSQLGPLQGYSNVEPPGEILENEEVFKEYFEEDYARLEGMLLQHLGDLPYTSPFADLPHYLSMIAVPDGQRVRRAAGVFISPELASKWNDDRLGQLTLQQRSQAAVQVLRLPNRQAAEQRANQFRNRR